ncbi:MAG: ComEC/Rec2 family competence protein [Acidithiobacillus sp.]
MRNTIVHKRQQWPVGHGCFHSAYVQANKTTFHYIYDCGSKKPTALRQQINRYIENQLMHGSSCTIDMLVISHFHADHINGIDFLFSKNVTVKNIVVPHLNDDYELLVLAQLAARGPAAWGQLSGLVIDPSAWVRSRNQETNIIKVSDIDGANLDITSAPTEGEGWNLDSNEIHHTTPIRVYTKSKPFWLFKFYVQREDDIKDDIINEITKCLNKTKDDLKRDLKNPSWIKRHWRDIERVFSRIVKPHKQNAISLLLHSAPDGACIEEILARYKCWRLKNKTCMCLDCCLCSGLGWLGTGDAELKSPTSFSQFKSHFSTLLDRVDTIMIPHHGSILNYNSELAEIAEHSIITSNYNIDPRGQHPSQAVMDDLKINGANPHVVTLEDSTSVFQYFVYYYL